MRRIKKRNKHKKTIVIITLIILLFLAFIIKKYYSNNTKTPNVITKEIEIEKEKTYTTKLIMVGDALVHDSLYEDANRNANYNGYDFKPYLKYIKEKVSDYDIAYYNQETILGGTSIGLSSYPSFNSPQELGDAMIDAGFNTVSLATNHTLDRGKTAIINSREYWNNQKDITAIGSYTSYEEKENIESKILTSNNITYAILNYTYGTNGIPVPNNENYLVNLWDDTYNYEGYKQQVEADINKLRDKVDILIVAMHWGREYIFTPTDLVKETANYLSKLGVDIIIGTHPHVIEPVEYINNTLVFYSLGNFISAQTSSSCSYYKCNIGLMSSLEIIKTVNGTESKIEIKNIENELIYTYHNNYTNFLVIPFSNSEIKTHLDNYEEVYNYYANIIKTDDERITTIPLSN